MTAFFKKLLAWWDALSKGRQLAIGVGGAVGSLAVGAVLLTVGRSALSDAPRPEPSGLDSAAAAGAPTRAEDLAARSAASPFKRSAESGQTQEGLGMVTGTQQAGFRGALAQNDAAPGGSYSAGPAGGETPVGETPRGGERRPGQPIAGDHNAEGSSQLAMGAAGPGGIEPGQGPAAGGAGSFGGGASGGGWRSGGAGARPGASVSGAGGQTLSTGGGGAPGAPGKLRLAAGKGAGSSIPPPSGFKGGPGVQDPGAPAGGSWRGAGSDNGVFGPPEGDTSHEDISGKQYASKKPDPGPMKVDEVPNAVGKVGRSNDGAECSLDDRGTRCGAYKCFSQDTFRLKDEVSTLAASAASVAKKVAGAVASELPKYMDRELTMQTNLSKPLVCRQNPHCDMGDCCGTLEKCRSYAYQDFASVKRIVELFKTEISQAQAAAGGAYASGKQAIDTENKMVAAVGGHLGYVEKSLAGGVCIPAPDACRPCQKCTKTGCTTDPHCTKVANASGMQKFQQFNQVKDADVALQDETYKRFYEPWCARYDCTIPGADQAKRLSADLQGHVQVLSVLSGEVPEGAQIAALETEASKAMADAKFYLEKPKGNYGQNLMDAALETQKASTAVGKAAAIWGRLNANCKKK